MPVPDLVRIHLASHRSTGLFMATSRDVPGFVVHAHSEEELRDKLETALNSYMRALGERAHYVVDDEEPAAGFWPPEVTAHREMAEAA